MCSDEDAIDFSFQRADIRSAVIHHFSPYGETRTR